MRRYKRYAVSTGIWYRTPTGYRNFLEFDDRRAAMRALKRHPYDHVQVDVYGPGVRKRCIAYWERGRLVRQK